MQDLFILHANKIFPQNRKDDFKAYTYLYVIDKQVHSIPKPTKQKSHDWGLSDLHEEEFKLFAMEYNVANDKPSNELDHYVKTHSNGAMKTTTLESMICFSTTSIQHFRPCRCKISTR
jgi:aminopeptidase-like protein